MVSRRSPRRAVASRGIVAGHVLEKAFEKKTTGKEVGMGERAMIIAVTAAVLILLLVLYIFFLR